MSTFGELYEAKFKEVEKMSRPELEAELVLFRNLWTWIPDDYKYWLVHVGYTCRLVRRDYHEFVGTLGITHWELKQIEIEVIEPLFNYERGIKTWETKTVVMPLSQIVDYQLIHGREEEVINEKRVEEEEREPLCELILE